MHDFIVPPSWDERSNWNAAIVLTRTAARMMAMELDHDLARTLSRSAGAIATLGKPLTRIAEAASLSIIGTIDETSVEILTEWLQTGRAEFVDFVDEKWRIRRDYVIPE
jgi:HEAT repeat protein